jgi:hypothetical protein
MRQRLFALLLAAPVGALAGPVAAVTISWVTIGNPGNAEDPQFNSCIGSCGSVAYVYRISKYEVTNAQYAAFLNSVAKTDPYGLYNTSMASDPLGGITRSGSSGSYSYSVKTGRRDDPVVLVSWYDALRFANWLHNGQPTGPVGPATTEDGAYTFSDPTTVGPRNPGAILFLPSEAEWYKAAFYDAVSASYFDYPTGTDTQIGCVAPPSDTGNSANCNRAVGALTNVGAYTLSASPYGTFDQGGNVFEWNESTRDPYGAGVRGGSWASTADILQAFTLGVSDTLREWEDNQSGFRVAHVVPEPGTGLLVMAGLFGLAARAKRLPSRREPLAHG